MKLLKFFKKEEGLSLRHLALAIAIVCLPAILVAQAPQWWTDRNVTNNNPVNDYAAANQGQVKNIAVNAIAELDGNIAGGAGDGLHLLAITLSATSATTNDYAAINLGQLKRLSQPFFDKLLQTGYKGHPLEKGTYPWLSGSANDYAMANVGQVKNLFSFDLATYSVDADGNQLPDNWEIKYFGHNGVDSTSLAPSGILLENGSAATILQAYQNGINPVDFYNGQIPEIWMYDGNGQTGRPGAFITNPLVVVINGASFTWPCSTNAPVQFLVLQGGGFLATGTSAPSTLSTLQARSDYDEFAKVYYQEPTGNPITSVISASAGKSAPVRFISYNGSTTVGEWRFDEENGTTVADSSGAGGNGAFQNGVAWTKSFDYSGAAQFDGQTGYVEVPNTSTFNIGIGPMTVMAWVRLSSQAPLAADTDLYNIVYKGSTGGNGIQLALSGGTNNGLIGKVFVNGSCQQITPQGDLSTALSDGNWHHVAFKRDENGNADLFFDGNEISNASEGRMSGSLDCAQPLWIGCGESGGYFNGTIDHVTVWRSCVSNEDIWNAWDMYNADTDGNQLPDWWEYKYFHNIHQDPTAKAPRGDGLTLMDAYQQKVDPLDFYDGSLPTLAIVEGGDQRGNPGAMLPVPVSVSINAGVYNAPITFTVTSGSALLTATNGSDSVPASSVMVRSVNQHTTANGQQQNVAQVYLWLPNNSNDISTITATATSGTQSRSISTTVATIDPTLSAPTGLVATPTSPTTANLTWIPAVSTQPTTIQASVDGGVTWFNVAAVSAGVSTLTITNMPTDVPVSFRAITGNVTGSGAVNGTSVSISAGGPIGSGGGGGGGSSSSGGSTATSLGEIVIMGRTAACYGYRYGDINEKNGKVCLRSETTISGSAGSTTTVNTWGPEIKIDIDKNLVTITGACTSITNITGDGGQDGYWMGCQWIDQSETTRNYWVEYTSEAFISDVESSVPKFSRDFTAATTGTLWWASINLSQGDMSYSIQKLQYKFKVNSDPNAFLVWDVLFVPSDGSEAINEFYTWQTNGATESPVYTIDPTQLNNKKNGYYFPLPIVLKDVSFGGPGYIELKSDDGSKTYSAPQWSSSGTNAVAFEADTAPSIGATIKIPTLSGITWQVRVTGDDEISVPATTLTTGTVDGEYVMAVTPSTEALDDKVRFYDDKNDYGFELNWEISADGGQTWNWFATTTHTMYVTLGYPKTMNNNETLFYIGCMNADGKNSWSGVIQDVLAAFASRDLRRASDRNHALTYYANKSLPYRTPPYLDGLLASGNGRCGAFQDLMMHTFLVQGITSCMPCDLEISGSSNTTNAVADYINRYGTDPLSIYNPRDIFYVKDWTLNTAPSMRWSPQDNPGAPSQGNNDPIAIFNDHAIVRIVWNAGITEFYDPSYGTGPFVSVSDWEDKSIDGYGSQFSLDSDNNSFILWVDHVHTARKSEVVER